MKLIEHNTLSRIRQQLMILFLPQFLTNWHKEGEKCFDLDCVVMVVGPAVVEPLEISGSKDKVQTGFLSVVCVV